MPLRAISIQRKQILIHIHCATRALTELQCYHRVRLGTVLEQRRPSSLPSSVETDSLQDWKAVGIYATRSENFRCAIQYAYSTP